MGSANSKVSGRSDNLSLNYEVQNDNKAGIDRDKPAVRRLSQFNAYHFLIQSITI